MALPLVSWSTTFTALVIAALGVHAQSYTAVPRWGQASTIIYNTLFVSGGKTDPEHQFTYTSAPNTNDLLSLNLSVEFTLSSPPWSYLSGTQKNSSSQGPVIAFHTLTPYTSSNLLLFGGDSGFNTIQTNADSAWLLDAKDLLSPSWSSQTTGWALEPIRRVYHAAPSASGAIYLLGGLKADGSQIGFPDSYLFNAVSDSGSPSFIPLSSATNAPTGLFGHAAHVLPGGMLLVFGGFFSSVSSPISSPLSVIYTLDTTSSSPTWSVQNATGTILTPRRGFASALLDNGKILIHGGADAPLQTLYSDGALLDTTQNPMSWSPVDVLSGTLGPRVGHFAAPIHGQVLFGFGWAGNAPANANLALYDPTSSAFQPSYTPQASPVSITTLPISPTVPGGTYPTSGVNTGISDGSGSPTRPGADPLPTSSSGNGQSGGGSGGQDDHPKDSKPPVKGVVLGSVFGFLAFAGLVGGGVYYALRRRESRAWMGIDANDRKDVEGRWRLMPESDPWDTAMDGSPTHPGPTVQMAGTGWHGQSRNGWGLRLGALVGIGGDAGGRRRLDMLADEDAREFDIDSVLHDDEVAPWHQENPESYSGIRREGTGGSSVLYETPGVNLRRSLWSGVWNASVTSVKNVGVVLGVTATGPAAAREGIRRNVNPSQWWEKDDLPLDPFADSAATAGHGQESDVNSQAGIYANTPMRPRGGDYSENPRASNPYVDPFGDLEEDRKDTVGTKSNGVPSPPGDFHDEGTTSTLGSGRPESSQSSLPRSFAMTGIAQAGARSPSPSERGTSVESHDASSSRTTQTTLNTGTGVASSSTDHSSSISSPVSPRTTSIIGALSAPTVPIRRSDSWWSRFRTTSFLDRHSFHDASQYRHVGDSGLVEFRDPNPAPRLGPIQESAHSSPQATLDDSPPSATASGSGTAKVRSRKAGSGYAASTKSSVKTADSELIERIDGRMEVVQRALSLTSRGTASPTTTLESPEQLDDTRKWGLSPVEASSSGSSHRQSWATMSSAEAESYVSESPTEEPTPQSSSVFSGSRTTRHDHKDASSADTHASSSSHIRSDTTNVPPLAGPRPPRRALTGAIAARVSAYERRMSHDTLAHNGPRSPPADTKSRERERQEERNRRGGVGYGLAPKAPLFVANPDRRDPSGSM